MGPTTMTDQMRVGGLTVGRIARRGGSKTVIVLPPGHQGDVHLYASDLPDLDRILERHGIELWIGNHRAQDAPHEG